MTVVVWLTETTWPACVDAARRHAPALADDGGEILLLHVTDTGPAELAHGSFAGLLGRGHRDRDPGTLIEARARATAADLLDAAAQRLGRAARTLELHGRPEHEVVHAAAGANLLICGRDGDPSRRGPRSLGPATRFVIDHAPCPVLLIWPGPAPDRDTARPAPPPHPPHA